MKGYYKFRSLGSSTETKTQFHVRTLIYPLKCVTGKLNLSRITCQLLCIEYVVFTFRYYSFVANFVSDNFEHYYGLLKRI